MRVTVFLSCLFLLLSSCTGIFRENGGSGVFLELPAWPPQDALEENYPPITGWNITVHYGSCFRIYSVPADSTHVQIEPWRGLPVAVTAEPAAANGFKFKPCGTVFPYYSGITWQGGFAADTLIKLYSTCASQTGISSDCQKFNWVKFMETMELKKNSSEIFYNPWYLDQETILKSIITRKFSTSLLNQKNCVCLSLQEFKAVKDGIYIHPYVPQNHASSINELMTIKKSAPCPLLNIEESESLVIAEFSEKEILSLTVLELPIHSL